MRFIYMKSYGLKEVETALNELAAQYDIVDIILQNAPTAEIIIKVDKETV